MSANYRMEQNPPSKDHAEQTPLHPRIVPRGTLSIKELMKHAKGRSTFTEADISGAMKLIADLVTESLLDGYNVELEGIGYLSVSLQSRSVLDAKELRSESVHFKNVNFRCSSQLKHALKTMPLTRYKEEKLPIYDAEEKEYRLMWYLDRNPFITVRTYRGLNPCSRYIACKELDQFVAEGKLVPSGSHHIGIYTRPTAPPEGKPDLLVVDSNI